MIWFLGQISEAKGFTHTNTHTYIRTHMKKVNRKENNRTEHIRAHHLQKTLIKGQGQGQL